MSSLNQVNIIGRLGQGPEYRELQNGGVANLSVATSERWKDKNTGETKEATEWHRVVLYGRLAEIARDYLAKGCLVAIVGSLKTRKWQDQSGQDRYSTEINGSTLKILVGKQDGNRQPSGQHGGWGQPQQPQGGAPRTQQQPRQASGNNPPTNFDDDIPF